MGDGHEERPTLVSNPIPKPLSQSEKSPQRSPGATSEAAGKKWNTKALGSRLRSDLLAAGTAGICVAPIITVIDRGIIENASGRNKLTASVKRSLKELLLRPHRFLTSKPFGLIYMLYTTTYIAANTLDTFSSTIRNAPSITTYPGPAKFAATSSVNMSLSLVKDSSFTRLFGPRNAVPRPLPRVSYALFALRDSMTIFASFNVPPLLAPYLPLTDAFAAKVMSRNSVAQFLAPAAIQLASTPLHLLGLDLYNRGERGVSKASRWERVRRDWLKSSVARMCRIVPAFGVGGVVNSSVRRKLIGGLGD